MAVKKPLNIFKLSKVGEPEGVFNWRLWFAVASFSLLGAARGVDEGLISGTFASEDFRETIGWSNYSANGQADLKANVSAMVQIGSVAGAMLSFTICDRVGRVWAARILVMLWALGITIFMAGGSQGNVASMYAGRFIAGLGVGQTPVVGTIYVAEVTPPSIRGLCTCLFASCVYIGIVLAYFANYGAALHLKSTGHGRWLIPTSLHLMICFVMAVLSLFQSETPRYLIKQGRHEEAAKVLARLRQQPIDGEYVQHEIALIQAALDEELEATKGIGFWGKVKELFTTPSNIYRLHLAIMCQIWSQWTGAGSITLYAPDLFKILGIEGHEESLLVSCVFGLVKLFSSFLCAFFLVDVIGRKRSLMLGISVQALSMIYVASFLTKYNKLGVVDNFEIPASGKGAGTGAVAMIYVSGVGWGLGWESMQYLLTAELFPLRVRALATSIAMTLHFANQYGNSRAVPNMLLSLAEGGITPAGTFWSFSIITLLGGVWVFFFIPETSGRTLESMDRLFELPWYRIGLYGNKDAERRDAEHEQQEKDLVYNVEQHHMEHKSA